MPLNKAIKQELPDEEFEFSNHGVVKIKTEPGISDVPKYREVSKLPTVPSLPEVPALPSVLPKIPSTASATMTSDMNETVSLSSDESVNSFDRSVEILDDNVEESDKKKGKKPIKFSLKKPNLRVKLSFEDDEEDGDHTCKINPNHICNCCFKYKFSGKNLKMILNELLIWFYFLFVLNREQIR